MISQWRVGRLSRAVVIFASPKTAGHSPKARFAVDDDRGAFVEAADEVEEKLAAGLGERQIYQIVYDDEVEHGDKVGELSPFAVERLRLEPVDQIDDVVEESARAVSDQGAGKRDRQVGGFPVPVPPTRTMLRCSTRNVPVAS